MAKPFTLNSIFSWRPKGYWGSNLRRQGEEGNFHDDEKSKYPEYKVFIVAQMVRRLSTMWEPWIRSLGQEDPLEKEMAP